MNEAKINSLEIEDLAKQAKIDKFNRIVNNMTAEIKRLKANDEPGTNNEIKKKVKR